MLLLLKDMVFSQQLDSATENEDDSDMRKIVHFRAVMMLSNT
jgi:hypothetical protein